MRKCFTIIILLTVLSSINAQNYQIKFSGNGESNNVSQVKIENLTQQTSLTISGTDILLLKKYLTGVDNIKQFEKENLKIFPNPMSDYTYLNFSLPESGLTIIEIFDISGRNIKSFSDFLNSGIHTYRLEGLETGIYLVKVSSNQFMSSVKLINNKEKKGISSQISLKNISFQSVKELKSAATNVEMQYNDGDRLKFIGISGNHKTVVMDTPSSNKTINFEFISCIDSDGRGYEVVKIGNQWWMAENLAYLPSVSPAGEGAAIVNSNEKHYYVYLYEDTNINIAKTAETYKVYGVLYNWHAATNSTSSSAAFPKVQGVCPSGWHIPNDLEWEELAKFVNQIKGPYTKRNASSWNDIGTHLKSTKYWQPYNYSKLGSDDFGFNGLPAGVRNSNLSKFHFLELDALWWSSTQNVDHNAYSRHLSNSSNEFMSTIQVKANGFSVRCIKN